MGNGIYRCPFCNSETTPKDSFCSQCGSRLNTGDKESEHRYVTVFFSDLSGYTSLSEQIEPEELKGIMDRIFTEATKVIGSYGGIVEKFIGDEVVALFGVNKAHEDDAIRAVKAADEIHGFVEVFGSRIRSSIGRDLHMHTGINTGHVLVERYCEATGSMNTVGRPMNIASRLSSMARPGEILINESVAATAQRHFHLECIGKRPVRGLHDHISVYRVIARRQRPLTTHSERGVISEMVGREQELTILLKKVQGLLQGSGDCVYILGEAGVGKSRLIHEFRQALETSVRFYDASCIDHAKVSPYYPVSLIVKDMLDISDDGADPESIGHKVAELTGSDRHAPYLLTLCGTGDRDQDTAPEKFKAGLYEAITALIKGACLKGPTIICIEDIHWADHSSLDLIRNMFLDETMRPNCLFILSSRKDPDLDLPGTCIRLCDLSRKNVTDMLRQITCDRDIAEGVISALYNTTAGNPFYVEEVLGYLLNRDQGLDSLAAQKSLPEIPSSVQAIISARLDQLDRRSRKVLQEASVIGRIFSRGLLERISSIADNMDHCIDGLLASGLITDAGNLEYGYRHAFTQEAAYRSILKDIRSEIHRRVGVTMEGVYSNEINSICDILAYHFDQGQDRENAVHYSIMAAEKSERLGSLAEASNHYAIAEKNLGMMGNLPDTEDTLAKVWEGMWSCARIFDPSLAVHALESLVPYYGKKGLKEIVLFTQVRLINLYSQKGLFRKALGTYEYVINHSGEDPLMKATASTVAAYTYTYLGRPNMALEYLDRGALLLKRSDRFLYAVNCITRLAALVWKGGIKDALNAYTETIDVVDPYFDLKLMAGIWHGYIHYLAGNFHRAHLIYEEARRQEMRLGSMAGGLSYLRIQSSIYFNSRYTGDLDKARTDLTMFERLSAGIEGSDALKGLYTAWIAIGEQRHESAVALLEDALPALKGGAANRVPYAVNALAEALMMAGELDRALDTAKEGIDWNEKNGNTDQLIWALRISGQISIRQGMYEEASTALKKTTRHACKGMLGPHKAWALASWGDLYSRTGNEPRALECYKRARRLWLDMGNEYQAGLIS